MATPVFCCGFECGADTLSTGHFGLVGGAAFETGTVRSGAYSLRRGAGSSSAKYGIHTETSTSMGNVFRFYVRFVTLPTVDCPIASFGGNPYPAVMFKNSDTKLYAGFALTPTFGSTGVSVTTGVWYRIDVKFDSSADPWKVDVQVDGTACGQATASSVSSSQAWSIYLGNQVTTCNFDAIYDDVWGSQTAADYPFGAGYVHAFVPTSDNSHNVAGAADFKRTQTGTDITNATTDAYTLVDDVPMAGTTYVNMVAPPNATDYVQCVFGAATGSTTPTVAPRAVDYIGLLSTASAGGTPTMDISLRLNDNGTTSDIFVSSTYYSTTWQGKHKHFATAPTGGAWTVVAGNGNFNNLMVRMGSYDAADSAPDGYFGSQMIEAEFAEATPADLKPAVYVISQSVNRASTY